MLKILIAEDDLVSRKLLVKILSEFGDCDLVINGIEAVEAFLLASKEKEQYDLICLDIMMPKIDGVTVLRTIRDLEQQNAIEKLSRIIIVTALSDSEVEDDAISRGADAYVPKPININKLHEILKKLELI